MAINKQGLLQAEKVLPVLSERSFWESLNESRELRPVVNSCIESAERASVSDIPALKASWFLGFQRTGNRSFFQDKLFKRRGILEDLVIAECVENRGRFLDTILDYIWAVCEESTWALPAHDQFAHKYGDGLPDTEKPCVALFSGSTAMQLVISHRILGEKLPEMCKKRIEFEVAKRITEPFLNSEFFWTRSKNNWNPVCNNSVLWSAILLPGDKKKVSEIIKRALKCMPLYIDAFDSDGGTTEGISYWNYGFSRYIMAAYILENYGGAGKNLLKAPVLKKISRFPLYVELSPNHFLDFADASSHSHIDRSFLLLLSKKLGQPELAVFAKHFSQSISLLNLYELKETFRMQPASSKSTLYSKSFYFKEMEWMISRRDVKDPESLVFAAKCGHNAEMHNHNDVGNFVLRCCGDTFIADTGAPVYTKQTFGERRYELFPCASRGHSVPVIDNILQCAGDFKGRVLDYKMGPVKDSFSMDISGAYPPEAGLLSLVRSFVFDRTGKGELSLKDEFSFKKPALPEEVFITFLKVQKSGNSGVIIRGEKASLEIKCLQQGVTARVETLSAKSIEKRAQAACREKEKYLRRIIFTPAEKRRDFLFDFKFTPRG